MGYKMYRNRVRAHEEMDQAFTEFMLAVDTFGDCGEPEEWGVRQRTTLMKALYRAVDAMNKMRYYATTLEPISDAE